MLNMASMFCGQIIGKIYEKLNFLLQYKISRDILIAQIGIIPIKEKKLRNSKQRDLILNIINNSYTHPTAEEIYERAREEIPNISLGTVYRNLDVLYSIGSIRRINLQDNTYRFDRACNNHSHFICSSCQSVIDISEEMFENMSEIYGNKVLSYDIIFKGICRDCLKREE